MYLWGYTGPKQSLSTLRDVQHCMDGNLQHPNQSERVVVVVVFGLYALNLKKILLHLRLGLQVLFSNLWCDTHDMT